MNYLRVIEGRMRTRNKYKQKRKKKKKEKSGSSHEIKNRENPYLDTHGAFITRHGSNTRPQNLEKTEGSHKESLRSNKITVRIKSK